MQTTIKKTLTAALMGMSATWVAAQTPPPPHVNHNVVGWMSNRLPSTLEPDSYTCSPPPPGSIISTEPGPAAPVGQRYDGNVIAPLAMRFSTSDLHISLPEGTYPTLVQFNNLSTTGTETYVDFPFSTTASADSDFILNQAFYSMNSGTNYGSQFQTRMSLLDSGSNLEYPLAGTNPLGAITPLTDSVYFFVNNQTWPLLGSPAPNSWACGPTQKINDQGIPGTVQTPVPLQPGHAYVLRAYLSLQDGATDRRAMIDDVMLYMQTVTVDAQDDGLQAGGAVDPAFSFQAQSGGNTPIVLTNDRINTLAVPATNFTLSQVNADAGLTLDTASGTITVAPGQPGTKKLTYKLCPKYDQAVIPNFQSNACKQATATVTLIGPGVPQPAATAQAVPGLQSTALLLLSLLAGVLGIGAVRRRR